MEATFNKGLPELSTSICDLENLIRSAPVKTYVQDLTLTEFKERKAELADVWMVRSHPFSLNLCSHLAIKKEKCGFIRYLILP